MSKFNVREGFFVRLSISFYKEGIRREEGRDEYRFISCKLRIV